ncbi:MAG: hypothetical protein KJO69_05270 [Gammaproteobacteria bacterium]|nr:hypothetical protein [Gammaproteobacteria bacterium]
MPYYVFRIIEKENMKELEHLETFSKYQEAKQLVRTKRGDKTADDTADYRMIFAKNETEAETLLKTPRDERVIGED